MLLAVANTEVGCLVSLIVLEQDHNCIVILDVANVEKKHVLKLEKLIFEPCLVLEVARLGKCVEYVLVTTPFFSNMAAGNCCRSSFRNPLIT